MKLVVGFEDIPDAYYTMLIQDLSLYSPCTVTRQDGEVCVETEGDVVKCTCVVAICDRYRDSKGVAPRELPIRSHHKRRS